MNRAPLVGVLSAVVAAAPASACPFQEDRASFLQSQFTSQPIKVMDDGHPLTPACLGYGGTLCAAASASGSSGGAWQSSTAQTLAMKVDRPVGCESRPCWMMQIRVAMDGSNSVQCQARAGVYTNAGKLLASTDPVQVAAGSGSDSWLELPFRGLSLELHATEANGDLWVAVQFEQQVEVILDATTDETAAARVADEAWAAGLATSHDWAAETGRRTLSSTLQALRVQLYVGDISILSGTLPVVIEAPHGGRMQQGWPARSTGNLNADTNTDLFAEALYTEISSRCGGHAPKAVILRVHRQGVDANRAVGTATYTSPQGTLCSEESGGQCCCDLTDVTAQANAMSLTQAYQAAVLAAGVVGTGSFLISVHGLARERLELGVTLTGSDLNTAYQRNPPSLDSSDWSQSTFRPLGPAGEQAEMTWGATGLGARLAETNPGMSVIPSPTIPCPDTSLCTNSDDSSFFSGGYVLKLVATDTQPGVQIELPPTMRNRGYDYVSQTTVRRVAAGIIKFLNEHWDGLPAGGATCNESEYFGVTCGSPGTETMVAGGCTCNTGYDGETCEQCAENYYQQDDGSCITVETLGVSAQDLESEKHASTSQDRVYWRRATVPNSLACGAQDCPVLSLRGKVYCDSSSCDERPNDDSYQMGAAVYNDAGVKVCEALSEQQTPRTATDWWLDVPLSSCPLLSTLTSYVYLAFWFTKDQVRMRWERESPENWPEMAHSCDYDTVSLPVSADSCVDSIPPTQLPSWRDDDCTTLTSTQCRTWSGDYYGPMIQLVYSTS